MKFFMSVDTIFVSMFSCTDFNRKYVNDRKPYLVVAQTYKFRLTLLLALRIQKISENRRNTNKNLSKKSHKNY